MGSKIFLIKFLDVPLDDLKGIEVKPIKIVHFSIFISLISSKVNIGMMFKGHEMTRQGIHHQSDNA